MILNLKWIRAPGQTPARLRARTGATALAGILSLLPLLPAGGAHAAEALVAVAANFADAMDDLEHDFERSSGHRLRVTMGSTGKLYAQLTHGAPFDVLLAADQQRPELLEQSGLAVAGSRFTYATGRLALWSADPAAIALDGATTLRAGDFRRLAIANPDLAPYGVAARETLVALGVYEALRPRIVMGENVGQTHALVATGNAELGLIALSSVMSPMNRIAGSRWDVPASLHNPIRQDAVLMARARANPAARDFLAYLQGEQAAALIERFGYQPSEPAPVEAAPRPRI